jgi:sialate O-acetylesterase
MWIAVWPCLIRAEVHLHPLFTDHAVLQQGKLVPVWGAAPEGEGITVTYSGQSVRTIAHNGHWMVRLAPMKARWEGSDLQVAGASNQVVVHDIVVGEVWVCSGQSNMEWPLRSSFQSEADIAASTNSHLRLFQVVKRRSNEVKLDLDYASQRWELSGPDSAKGFSAVGYYFGRDLARAFQSSQVPVGIIHTSWGGSPAEAWMSQPTLQGTAEYSKEVWTPGIAQYERWKAEVEKWDADAAAAKARNEAPQGKRPGQPFRPAELYNGMLASLMPYGIQGALWYQGESNAGRAWQYRRLFGAWIRSWRRDWEQGDFWFFAVQLAPWDKSRKRDMTVIANEVGDSNWAELREAQNFVAQTVPKVGVAVITDLGDKDDIHPTRKAPVGERLALLARARVYGEKVEFSGPVLEQIRIHGDSVHLRFGHAKGGLKTGDGQPLTGFSIAGADRKFHRAEARIDGTSRVVVRSKEVPNPQAVRYGWKDFPVVNLVNQAGLPTSPFRTDDWPVTTQPIQPVMPASTRK